MARTLAAWGALVALALGTGGCTQPREEDGNRCLPGALNVTPEVKVGGQITISALEATCTVTPATYQITLVDSVSTRLSAGEVRVGEDGFFNKVVVIPRLLAVGDARVEVTGSAYDACDSASSCAGYSRGFTIIS